MRRDEAIADVARAIARDHSPSECRRYTAVGHQAVIMVDALEALGVLKFDPPAEATLNVMAELKMERALVAVVAALRMDSTPAAHLMVAEQIILGLDKAGYVIVPAVAAAT